MPGRKQVGSISIKVTPDLDGFWGELKSKLEAIEKGLKGLIEMEPDMKGFREKVKAETSGMDADVKVKADLDQSDFLKTIAAVKAAAKDADTKINIDFRDAEAEAKLEGLILKLKAIAASQDIKLKVDVDGDFAQRGAIAGLRALGGSALDSLGNVRAFGIGLTAMLGIASLVAPGLALVSGALLVLPGIAAGALAPIAALALGFDGFKRAMDASGLMELVQGKTNKKGEKTGKDKQAPGQVIKDAQKQIADIFANGLTPVFTDFAQKALPPLTQALKPVATGIVDIISQFGNMITAGPGLQAIQNIFTNMGQTLTNMAPGIAAFGEGLLNLADKTVAKFPGLGKAFSDMGNQFSDWIGKITKPDATGVSDFDRAMHNLKDTLGEIAGLGKDLFNWSFDNLKNPEFGNSMKDFASTLRELIDTTLPAFNKAMEVVGLALKPFTTVIDALKGLNDITGGVLGKVARFAVGGVGDAFGAAPDAANSAGKQAGVSFSDGLKQMLQGQGQGAVVQGLQGILPDPAQAGDAGQQVGQQFANNFQSVITGSGNLAAGGGLFPGLPGFDPQSAAAVGQSTAKNFTDGFSNQLVAQPMPDLSGMLLGKSGDQGGNLSDLTGSIKAEIGSLAPEVQAAVDAASAPLSSLTTQITSTVSQAFSGLAGAAQGGLQALVGVVQGTSAQVVGIFVAMGPQIVATVNNISAQMVSAGAAIGQRLADGIAAGTGAAVAAMQNLAAAVQAQVPHSPAKEGPFSGAGWTALFTGGQAVAGQFSDGLKDGFQGVISQAQALAQQVADAMANGGTPGAGVADNIKQQLAAIKQESDQLRVQRDALPKGDPGRQTIKDQLSQLGTVRDTLKLQQDQLGYSKKYGDQQDKNGQIIEDSLNKMVGIGVDFGKANVNQFLQDIGASGNGAVESIADTGIGWATSMLGQLMKGGMGGGGTTIQVQSPEDALGVQRSLDARRQQQFAGR